MRKILLPILAFAAFSGVAAVTLENDAMRIVFGEADEGFAITRVEGRGTAFVSTAGEKADLFDLAFKKGEKWPYHVTNRSKARQRRCERTTEGVRLIFEGLQLHDEPDRVDVACDIRLKGALSEWRITVSNRSERYAILRTDYPLLRNVVRDGEADVLMAYKNRGGLLVPKCDFNHPVVGMERRHGYPGCHIPLAAFIRGDTGLYFAAHDSFARNKTLCFEPGIGTWFETPAENAGVAGRAENGMRYPAVIGVFRGDWWQAAHIYRDWATRQKWCAKGKIADRIDYPQRTARTHLWVIGGGTANNASNILTRMNTLWPDVGKCMEWSEMCDKRGNQLDPEWGRVKEGVAEVAKYGRNLGIMIMPYVNGRIWDTNLCSFAYAQDDACLRIDGKVAVERYDGVDFAVMCPSCPTWREIIRRKGVKMLDAYNADAVYLDQVACSRPPELTCYAARHGHTVGGGTWWESGYRKMLKDIRSDFSARKAVITSEQMGETWIDLIDHFLDATPRNACDVPLFAAVYSGYALSHGARIGEKTDDVDYFRENARTILQGEAFGWIGIGIVLHKANEDKAAILHRLAKRRDELRDFLVYGTLEGEVRSVGADDTQIYGTWWKSADGLRRGAAIANAEKEIRKIRFTAGDDSQIREADLPPMEITWVEFK